MSNPEKLLIIQRQLTVAILGLLLLSMVFLIGFYFADILRILGIALLLSYMMINIVDWLEKHLRNRALSVILVYLTMLGLMVLAILLIIPSLVWQVSQLVQTTINALPDILNKINLAIAPLEQRFRTYQIDLKVVDILNDIVMAMPKPDPSLIVCRMTDVAMSTMTWLLYGISISVVTFYFLLDGFKLKESLINLFPQKHKAFLLSLAADADKSLQSFFRGQIVLGLAFGLVMLVIYLSLGVQYALLLGLFLGLMEILPVIGPPIGFIPALISVAFHGMSVPGNKLTHVIVLTLIFTIMQQFKDNIIAPKYMGKVLRLHPVIIFIAILVGARLDGTLGIIFSIPVACVLNVSINHIRKSNSYQLDISNQQSIETQNSTSEPETES